MAKVESYGLVSEYLLDMKDGDVAEVISWHNDDIHTGAVVQRYSSALVIIGEGSGKCYPNIFDRCDILGTNKIRILKSGSRIVL